MIPDYICASIADVVERLGIPFRHYHINNHFEPNYESIAYGLKEYKSIVLVTYFGMVDINSTIRQIRSEFPETVIIVDDVQNFYGFGNHFDYDYCFNSYRKWFPVPDGAEIRNKYGPCLLNIFKDDPEYAKYKFAGNLLKGYRDLIDDSFSLKLIDIGEGMMDAEYRYQCSKISRKLIQGVDFEMAGRKRKKNAKVLHKGLEELGVLHLYNKECTPMFIPVILSNRDDLRKVFFEKGMFMPIHWPLGNEDLQGRNELYRTELSLVCDQRYDEDDMDRILKVLKNEI